MNHMNLLVSLNANYLTQLVVMLTSLLDSNPHAELDVYIAHKALTKKNLAWIREKMPDRRVRFFPIQVSDEMISDAPISYRYPREMYYRIFAAQYLPRELSRILYLDPDIVVRHSLSPLYHLDFRGNLLIASSHVHSHFNSFNHLRLDMPEGTSYINSGVMLMNLELLRREQDVQEVLTYIEEYKNMLILPDQDVLNGLYGHRTLTVDPLLFNLDERYWRIYNLNPLNEKLSLEWVRRNTVVIHYCGKHKPWKENYNGKFGIFYEEARKKAEL